jgi:hypothetical protein
MEEKPKKSLRQLLGEWAIALIVFGVLAIGFAAISLNARSDRLDFAENVLPGWIETEGVFLDFHLDDTGVRPDSPQSSKNLDYTWWVHFGYILEYDANGHKQTVADTIERTGSGKRVPADELIPPYHTGEETFVVFDPDEPSRYEIGSKESVEASYRRRAGIYAEWYSIAAVSGALLIIAGAVFKLCARKDKVSEE